MTITRAWRLDRELFHNQGHKLVATDHAGLSPEDLLGLQRRLDKDDLGVAVVRVDHDVESASRNVVTEPDRRYQVVTDGDEVYLIEF